MHWGFDMDVWHNRIVVQSSLAPRMRLGLCGKAMNLSNAQSMQ